jgi:hypothetical protein
LKYWRGYLAAAIFAVITLAVTQFAKSHTVLMDMVYPYTTRLIQTTLAEWSAGVDFCLWQLLAVLLVVVVLASIVIMVILRWNVFQWLGWVLSGVSLLWMLHTGVYGLNNYAGPLAEDIRLNVTEYTVTELVEATTYFRDQANALAEKVNRKEDGSVDYPAFEELAQMAGEGFKTLTYDRSYSVFAGSREPVKKLGWADMYTSMGITGLTMPLTGEAAVNPNIPAVSMPFTMCHEMAHRMCITQERDANLAGFLAATAHSDPAFQYSGYFMAFRYCYSALLSVKTSTADNAARTIYAGMNSQMQKDMQDYDLFLAEYRKESAANFANSVNNAYIQASGDEKGIASYGEVCDLLVSWHIQEIYLPAHKDEEVGFDPTDKNQVQLGDNTHGN